MASIIQIKRSQTNEVPSGLANGEIAYSIAGDKLFYGRTAGAGDAVASAVIGGKYFTDQLDHAHGTLTGNSAIVVDTNSHVDNIITGGLKLTTSGGTANNMTAVLNDSGMSSANDSTLATSKSIKNYVDSQVGAASNDFDLAADSGSTDTFTTGGTLTFTGGDSVTTTVSDDEITIALDDDGVTTAKLDDGAVTAAKVGAGALTSNTIASDAITTAKIDDGAVTGAKLAAGTIAANAIASDAITTAKLDDGAVTAAKIANEGLGANTLASGAVTIGKIAAAALVTESEGIGSNDNDTTIPTSAAVQDLVDNYLTVANAGISVTDGSTSTTIDGDGGTLTFSGTANETTVSESSGTITIGLPDDVTIAGELNVSENVVISGNLIVSGTTTQLNTEISTINDVALKLAANNTADTVDFGVYGLFNDGSDKFSGYFRDASDGVFKFFNGITTEPGDQVTFTASTDLAQVDAIIDGGTF